VGRWPDEKPRCGLSRRSRGGEAHHLSLIVWLWHGLSHETDDDTGGVFVL
jgi:hypothetical protein